MTFANVRLALPGEWDLSRKDELGSLLRSAEGAQSITLDCSQTTLLDASALGQLVRLKNARIASGTPEIRLASVPDTLRRLLSITQLDVLFDFEEPESKATPA